MSLLPVPESMLKIPVLAVQSKSAVSMISSLININAHPELKIVIRFSY